MVTRFHALETVWQVPAPTTRNAVDEVKNTGLTTEEQLWKATTMSVSDLEPCCAMATLTSMTQKQQQEW